MTVLILKNVSVTRAWLLARRLCRVLVKLATANTALANAPITLRLVNVGRPQAQLNALGTAKLHTLHVKNVVLLIVTKPAVIMELTLAQTVAAENANVAHQPPPPALHQVVAPAHHQVVQALEVVLHHQVALHLAQEVLNQALNGVTNVEK